jgi:hypothetical protein
MTLGQLAPLLPLLKGRLILAEKSVVEKSAAERVAGSPLLVPVWRPLLGQLAALLPLLKGRGILAEKIVVERVDGSSLLVQLWRQLQAALGRRAAGLPLPEARLMVVEKAAVERLDDSLVLVSLGRRHDSRPLCSNMAGTFFRFERIINDLLQCVVLGAQRQITGMPKVIRHNLIRIKLQNRNALLGLCQYHHFRHMLASHSHRVGFFGRATTSASSGRAMIAVDPYQACDHESNVSIFSMISAGIGACVDAVPVHSTMLLRRRDSLGRPFGHAQQAFLSNAGHVLAFSVVVPNIDHGWLASTMEFLLCNQCSFDKFFFQDMVNGVIGRVWVFFLQLADHA